ncbi:hypothetical protein V1517DRAFT_352628 [Lipomyces orientalis]|uniref:Uncharacterized protein n=1 Tax=Lipomyces orientalis TaxID=1233043 RepID=A0ACC3TP17_9ASCO
MSLRPRPESAAETGLLSEADKRRLKSTKYPPEFDETVNLSKVNFPVIKAWIANEISEIAGGDDIVTEYTVSLFEQDNKPQIKAIQIQLEGFLPSSTIAANFCQRLWNLLLEAQESPSGIPAKLIEEKKIEVQQTRERQSLLEEQRKVNEERSAKLDEIRQRERRVRDERRDRDERRKMREGERIVKIPTDVTDTYVPSYADEKRSPLSFRERDRGLDSGRRRESPDLEYRRERERRERDRERRRERDYRSRSGSRDGEHRRDRSRDYIRDGSRERRRRERSLERGYGRNDSRERRRRERSLERGSRDVRSRERRRHERSREVSLDRRYKTDYRGTDRSRSRSRERRRRESRDYEVDDEHERERAMSPGRAQRRLEREREFQERLAKRHRYGDSP